MFEITLNGDMNPYKIAKYVALFINLALGSMQFMFSCFLYEMHTFWFWLHFIIGVYFIWFAVDAFVTGCRLQRQWDYLEYRRRLLFGPIWGLQGRWTDSDHFGILSCERVNWKRDGF